MYSSALSSGVNIVNSGSPSRIRIVRRISLGITTRPRSSIRRTIPVAFIYSLPFCTVGGRGAVNTPHFTLHNISNYDAIICKSQKIMRHKRKKLRSHRQVNKKHKQRLTYQAHSSIRFSTFFAIVCLAFNSGCAIIISCICMHLICLKLLNSTIKQQKIKRRKQSVNQITARCSRTPQKKHR